MQGGPPPTDLAELVSLVSAQQSTLYSQQAEIKQVRRSGTFTQESQDNALKSTFVYQLNVSQCDAESNYLEQQYFSSQQQQHLPPAGSSTSSLPGGGVVYHPAPPVAGPPGGGGGGAGPHQQHPGGSSGPNQIDVVLSEVGH